MSLYIGCKIDDAINDALREMNRTFNDIRNDTDAVLADIKTDLDQLSGTPVKATLLLGDVTLDNQVRWTAVASGEDGNGISVTYQYLGPIFNGTDFDYRPTEAKVVDNVVYVTLPVLGGALYDPDIGKIDPAMSVALCVPIWESGTGVSDLVTIATEGLGSGVPDIVNTTPLSGGKGTPLKDAEVAANDIAKQFGKNSYTDLLRSVSVPVIETEADLADYIESTDDSIVVVNKKVFIVSGTNLIGMKILFTACNQDIEIFLPVLEGIAKSSSYPHIVMTENLSSTVYDLVCNSAVPVTTVTPTFISYDEPYSTVISKSNSKDLSAINGYVFWIYARVPNSQAYAKLMSYGIIKEYTADILAGNTPAQAPYSDQKPQIVSVIEDPSLFKTLGLTNSEIVELLGKNIDGVSVPTANDPANKQKALNKLFRNNRENLKNGLRSKIKRPVVAAQAIDVSSTMNDKNLAKEMATRGKACARQSSKFSVGSFEIPTAKLDLPNIPSADLPDLAKKTEAAFGALSSLVDSASRLFDKQVDGMVKTCKSALNKIQNLLSLADNLLKNDLVDCLLGTSGVSTGLPDLPSPSNPGGNPSVSVGGIPLPMSLLTDALGKLSLSLDSLVTKSFEKLMNLLSYPLCMMQKLLSSLNSPIDIENLSPCGKGKNPDENCPPEDTQDIINASSEMTSMMKSLPQTSNFPTEKYQKQINESVENFTGDLTKTASYTTQNITRGIKGIMDDLMKSLNTKLEMINQIDKAIKELINESSESKTLSEENESNKGGCNPPSLGMFTDAVIGYI